jgi:hypothetical protein
MAISSFSFSASSGRPPLVKDSTDSRRCFSSVVRICCSSWSESGSRLSISLDYPQGRHLVLILGLHRGDDVFANTRGDRDGLAAGFGAHRGAVQGFFTHK